MPLLWVSLTGHGYGHASMTAPVVEAVRALRPDIDLVLQSPLDRGFLAQRFAEPFRHVAGLEDFGMSMDGPNRVRLNESAARYRALHQDLAGAIDREVQRLSACKPDLVLANVSYTVIAAAARCGIPAIALSCLSWRDIYGALLGERPEAASILAEMTACYEQADIFIAPQPTMDMRWHTGYREVGPLLPAMPPAPDRDAFCRRFSIAPESRIALVGFGGIAADALRARIADWPRFAGWNFITDFDLDRPDTISIEATGHRFDALMQIADAVICKPGYGTFAEAVRTGCPVVHSARSDWPETAVLVAWIRARLPSFGLSDEAIVEGRFGAALASIAATSRPAPSTESGVADAANIVLKHLPA